jgi:hypothetical protein
MCRTHKRTFPTTRSRPGFSPRAHSDGTVRSFITLMSLACCLASAIVTTTAIMFEINCAGVPRLSTHKKDGEIVPPNREIRPAFVGERFAKGAAEQQLAKAL